MTRLAYMVREDWAQQGTAMASQSAVIRDWLDDGSTLLAVSDVSKHTASDRGADVEAAAYLFPDRQARPVSFSALARSLRACEPLSGAAVILHPHRPEDLERVAEIVAGGKLARVFVLVWSPEDIIRWWLEGVQATDLNTGGAVEPAEPLMVEAARMMVDEAYNGLGAGRGKDVVVGLVRLFTARDFALDERAWLRAYFAAGGDFAHAESVKRLVSEMRGGTKHRVQKAFGSNVFELLAKRVSAGNR